MKRYLNPYKMFLGAFLPNWLLKSTDLSPSEKLTYARLCQFSGKDGKCFPKIDTIGQEIGLEDRQVRYNLKRLEEIGLIEVIRNPPHVNEYKFLWCSRVQVKSASNCRVTLQDNAPSIYEENHIRESSNILPAVANPSGSPLQTSFVCKDKKEPTMPRNWLPDILQHYGNEQGWTEKPDAITYRRFARAVKDLWIISKGDMMLVKKTISWVKSQKYPSWSLDTCVKRWYDANKKSKAECLPEL